MLGPIAQLLVPNVWFAPSNRLCQTVVFTTTPLCAVCNPWVQNAERYASQSVCINSNNDFGMPSRTYDCYCQPVGACQEKVKTEGYISLVRL